MFFRDRGKRVQCVRAYYDKVKGHGVQDIVFSFLESTEDIEGIDMALLKRLSPNELEQLKSYLSSDRTIVETLIEQASLCSIALRKKSFDKTSDIKGLKQSIATLSKMIWSVGL